MGRSRELAELAAGYDTGGLMGFANRIIGGDMRIDQRNAGAAVTSTGDIYTVDRWAIGHGAPINAMTAQRVTDAPATE